MAASLLQTAEGSVKVLLFSLLPINTNEPKLSFCIMLLSWAHTRRLLNKLHLTWQLCFLALVSWQQAEDALELHILFTLSSIIHAEIVACGSSQRKQPTRLVIGCQLQTQPKFYGMLYSVITVLAPVEACRGFTNPVQQDPFPIILKDETQHRPNC